MSQCISPWSSHIIVQSREGLRRETERARMRLSRERDLSHRFFSTKPFYKTQPYVQQSKEGEIPQRQTRTVPDWSVRSLTTSQVTVNFYHLACICGLCRVTLLFPSNSTPAFWAMMLWSLSKECIQLITLTQSCDLFNELKQLEASERWEMLLQ